MTRLVGTGKDPENRYPEGIIFDAPEALGEDPAQGEIGYPGSVQDLIDSGYAERLDPEDDPGKSESQIAAAVIRGDELNDPVEAAKAEKYIGWGENPEEGIDPYGVVHEDEDYASAGGQDVQAQGAKAQKREFDSDTYTSATAQDVVEDAGLDPEDVEGTSADGRITVDDAKKAVAEDEAAAGAGQPTS